jgi:uncharacterized protein
MTISFGLEQKLKALDERLAGLGRLAVAFSGGVDSAFLLKAASRVLPAANILALTVKAEIFPAWEAAEAAVLAAGLNVEHLMLELSVLEAPEVAANPPDRCYHCKKNVFQYLRTQARQRGFTVLADGGNFDDRDDYRPGTAAARELGVISPLAEVGLGKAEVREASAAWGLPTWNKPAYACLASRFPYGRALTREALGQVERAEDFLRSLGFRELRVRHHGAVARIEVGAGERRRFFDESLMDQVHGHMRSLGFAFVALDLAGYRSGGFNEAVSPAERKKYS